MAGRLLNNGGIPVSIFCVPSKIISGENAFDCLREYPIKRVCIICDPFVEKSGMLGKLLSVLEGMQATYRIFAEIAPDPDTELVVNGLQQMMQHKPDTVIAVGGGSAIDAAKAISFMYRRTANVAKPFCVAVPTTSGTGSEATNFAVITDKSTHIKYPIVDDSLLPDLAILEPSLVCSVPPHITADTGMDVLTHAVEAYVSTDAADFSDALAEKAVRLIAQYLPVAYADGKNMTAREHVHNASCMAGVAFTHARLGINHSIAHAIGGRYRIAHGRSNAIVLPFVIAFNAGLGESGKVENHDAMARYAYLGKQVGIGSFSDQQTVRSFIMMIEKMMDTFSIPRTLSKAGVEESVFLKDLPELASIALADACTANNPRSVDQQQMETLIKKVYYGR